MDTWSDCDSTMENEDETIETNPETIVDPHYQEEFNKTIEVFDIFDCDFLGTPEPLPKAKIQWADLVEPDLSLSSTLSLEDKIIQKKKINTNNNGYSTTVKFSNPTYDGNLQISQSISTQIRKVTTMTTNKYFKYHSIQFLTQMTKSIVPVRPIHTIQHTGICIDPSTNYIYIVDKYSHQIHILDKTGHLLHSFGSYGNGPGQFYKPTGIKLDKTNHRLIISDTYNHRICIYTLNGIYMYTFGIEGTRCGEFYYPCGIAVSPNGNMIAVADVHNQRIQLFGTFGQFLITEMGIQMNPTCRLCFDNTGQYIYFTDYNIHSIIIYNIKFTQKSIVTPPGYIHGPMGLTVDMDNGNIIICDTFNNCIRIVEPSSGRLVFTILPSNHNNFHTPLDIGINGDNEFIFIDENGVIWMY